MLDIRFIRSNPDEVKKGLAKRNADVDIDRLLRLDEDKRDLLKKVEALKAERNKVSEEIGALKKSGEQELAGQMALRMRTVSEEIKELDRRIAALDAGIEEILLVIPNLPHETVPEGKDEAFNLEVRRWGKVPNFGFEPKPHWEIGAGLDIIDFDRASKLSGSRFALLKGKGARLERALVNFMLDLHTKKHGYTEIFPPFMVNRDCMIGTGQLPKFEEDMFKVANNGFFLIPTAEVPVTNIHRDEILDGSMLPVYYTAYTACFRAEAGAAGKDTRGLIRNHQFNKVELVKFSLPEASYEELEKLVADAEEVLQALELPYRVVLLSTGDTGFSSAKTYDLEVWLPSYNSYREISSCSNFEEFQARRANLRFRRQAGAKVEYLHTLNGSGVAVGRTMAALLENFQNEDGSVNIPKNLQPYMDGISILT